LAAGLDRLNRLEVGGHVGWREFPDFAARHLHLVEQCRVARVVAPGVIAPRGVFVETEQSFDATGEGIERPVDRAGADVVRAIVAAALAPGIAAAVRGEGRRGLSRPAAQDQQTGCDQAGRFGMPSDCGPPSRGRWGRKPRRAFEEAGGG
jgi:hypothetical protein